MQIIQTATPDELAQRASELIIDSIQKKPESLLCLATGNSPTLTYQYWVNRAEEYPKEQFKIIKLDEWGGIPQDAPQSCEQYLRRYVIQPLALRQDQFMGFASDSGTPEEEVSKVREALSQAGGIDLCILGIGLNGHIGFNEPAEVLQPYAHIATLSEHSLSHTMVQEMPVKPRYGLTMGMGDILKSRKIMMLIQGESKREITGRLFREEVNALLPASFLWLHPQVTCFIDKAAYPA